MGFQGRHEGELEDPEGTLNMKIHNVFIAVLGPEIQYYTALVRSLDSSLGNMAINIAKLTYEVKQNVAGPLNNSRSCSTFSDTGTTISSLKLVSPGFQVYNN